MIFGKNDLINRMSDYLRKGWTNQQVKDLIDSLWRDPYSPRTSGFEIAGGTDAGISAEATMTEILGVPFYGIGFQITPIGRKFAFYQYRTKLSYHKKFTAEHLSFSAQEGLFAIYYDWDDTLKEQVLCWMHNPTHDELGELFQWVVPIMFLYYDATNNQIIYKGNNKHGSLWNPWIHFPWHQTFNSMRETGLAFTDLVADGDGDSDLHAQFGVSAGSCFHEDIYATSTAKAAPADFPVWYFNAANAPRIYDGSVNSLVVDGLLCYNEGGAVVPADDGNFVMYHIFFSNDLTEPFLSVMGQDQYDKVSTATLMIDSEVQDVKDKLPHQNLLHIGTLIFQTSARFGNTTHSRVVSHAYGVITDLSVTGDGSTVDPVVLVNDEDEPGYNMYYGTDELGIKGWHLLPEGTDEGSGSGSDSGSGLPISEHNELNGLQGGNPEADEFYHTTADENDAITGANSPSATNVFVTMNDLDNIGIVNKSDSFTFELTDAYKYVRCSKATDITGTIPPNSEVDFHIGTIIIVQQVDIGAITIVAGSGVTVNALDGNLDTYGQFASLWLIQVAENEWDLHEGSYHI